MPLQLLYYPSFDRSLKSLGHEQKEIVKRILSALQAYYESNCTLSKAQEIEPHFFYKQLRKPYYEAGVESRLRIVIEREKSECVAVLVGNHDQIRKFLNDI